MLENAPLSSSTCLLTDANLPLLSCEHSSALTLDFPWSCTEDYKISRVWLLIIGLCSSWPHLWVSLLLPNVGLMWLFPSLQSSSIWYQTLHTPVSMLKWFDSILNIKQRARQPAGSTLGRLDEVLASPISMLIPFTVSFWSLCLGRWGCSLKYLGSSCILKARPHLGCPSC